MSELVERLRGIYRIRITDGLGAVGSGDEPHNPNEFVRTFAVPPIHREAADEIERLTAANAALMAERASLIETKREQIERLTAERDAALAKLAQYEQALGTLHGDSLDAIMEVIGEGEKFASYNLGKSKMRDWFLQRISALIARPEVTK